jgi:hypothetical protein
VIAAYAVVAAVSSFAFSAPAVAVQPTLGDGAWCWFADPRAVRYDGQHRKTYLGWVAHDGDIMISAFDHDSFTRTTAAIHPKLQVDDHSNPAIQIRPDGRLAVYYSAHDGPRMYYRVSARPEDVRSWGPVQEIPTNTEGRGKGYTYPNPIHLSAEAKTYLFWRGGDFNPAFAAQRDGESTWSTAQSFIQVPGQRPYVKYDSDGEDSIHFAFTNAHPAESSTNIYYASYKAGAIRTADGTAVGSLGEPISPADTDLVYDTTSDAFPGASTAWVHDVAVDPSGRPVVVFAVFASPNDHRYFYARWTGSQWESREITPAGGSISADGREPYYSGGITLDHEDPSTVYLSRDVSGIFEVETWKTSDGGATWSHQAVTATSDELNVRPISPRGLIPFGGDLSVLWMRGAYQSYVGYRTSIAALIANGGNAPVADVEQTINRGAAPLAVSFDGTGSSDSDGRVVDWQWDFGDTGTGSGASASHIYRVPGHYFPKLTVTDDSGAQDVYVSEVEVTGQAVPPPEPTPAPEPRPRASTAGPALDLRSPLLGVRTGRRQRPLRSDGVIGRVRCDEPCSYRVYGRLDLRRRGGKIGLRQRRGELSANRTARLRLRFSKPSVRTLRWALLRGRRVRARVLVSVRDEAGNLTKTSRLVRLTR